MVQWAEHVHLLPDRVVGYWFCLDRHSGARLWERRLNLAEIAGIEDGIIVANKRHYVCDICTPRSGCCGISLETGKLLWTSHGPGLWSRLLSEFHSESPAYVADGKCYCWSGRVIDIHTGRIVNRIPQTEITPPKPPESDETILRRTKDPADPIRLRVGDGAWLSHKVAVDPTENIWEELASKPWAFRLFLTDDAGSVKWEFDLKNTGYEDLYDTRYSCPYLYLLVGETPARRNEKKPADHDPWHSHLLTLDLANGRIVQDIQITRTPTDGCGFEDIDASGVLVREGDRTLHYFPRRSSAGREAAIGGQQDCS